MFSTNSSSSFIQSCSRTFPLRSPPAPPTSLSKTSLRILSPTTAFPTMIKTCRGISPTSAPTSCLVKARLRRLLLIVADLVIIRMARDLWKRFPITILSSSRMSWYDYHSSQHWMSILLRLAKVMCHFLALHRLSLVCIPLCGHTRSKGWINVFLVGVWKHIPRGLGLSGRGKLWRLGADRRGWWSWRQARRCSPRALAEEEPQSVDKSFCSFRRSWWRGAGVSCWY